MFVAASVGLVVDVVAIVKGKKWLGVAILALVTLLTVILILEVAHSARLEAENKALTDAQARAQRLVDSWNNTGEFNDDFLPRNNLDGTNEGIAAAAADLMEDVRDCRPGAAEEARARLMSARESASQIVPDDFDAEQRISDIWDQAAGAAYEQVAGVAEVAPNC